MCNVRETAYEDVYAEEIRGVMVSRRRFAEVVEILVEWARRRDRLRYFACVNAHSAEMAHRDSTFMTALKQADLLVALIDGLSVRILLEPDDWPRARVIETLSAALPILA